MGVDKYKVRGATFWKIDERVVLPSGQTVRLRQRQVPTKEQAVARAAKMREPGNEKPRISPGLSVAYVVAGVGFEPTTFGL